MSLKKQTISGFIWTFFDTFLISGSFFVAMIYIARILGPEEVGLIGMITVFIGIGVSLVDSGLTASIIRTKDVDNSDFSTVFYLNLGMSFLMYSLLFVVAPYIADFYNQEILTGVIRLYCVSFLFSALSAVQLAQLTRNMQFRKIMQCNVPGTFISIVVGVILSLNGFGVWSIVWMQLTKQLLQSVFLWITSSWRPTLHFSKEKMKFHYGFGYKLLLSGLLNTVFNNVYNIIIGKFYSVETLGYFDRAKSFNTFPVTTLTGVISKVTYPLLSRIQEQKERVSSVYKQLLQFSFFISAPLMLSAAAIASPLFQLVLGDEWMPAVPFFQIICISSMFMPIHSINLNMLKVFGRSDLFLRLEIYKKLVIVIGILISLPFGIMGLVWSSVVVSFIALIINTYYSQDLINYKTGRQLLDLLPTLILSFLVSILMFCAVIWLNHYSLYIQIILPTIIGATAYLTINYFFKTSPMMYTLNLLKNIK